MTPKLESSPRLILRLIALIFKYLSELLEPTNVAIQQLKVGKLGLWQHPGKNDYSRYISDILCKSTFEMRQEKF